MRTALLLLCFAEALAVLKAPPLPSPALFQRYAAAPRSPRALPTKKTTYPLDAAIQTVISVFTPKKEFKTVPLPVSSRSIRPYVLPPRPKSRVKPHLKKFVRPRGGKARPGPGDQTRHLQKRPPPKQQHRLQLQSRSPPHLRRPLIKPQITPQANIRPQARPARSQLEGKRRPPPPPAVQPRPQNLHLQRPRQHQVRLKQPPQQVLKKQPIPKTAQVRRPQSQSHPPKLQPHVTRNRSPDVPISSKRPSPPAQTLRPTGNEVVRSPHSGELLTPERGDGRREKEQAILSLHSSLSQLVEMQKQPDSEKQDWLPIDPPPSIGFPSDATFQSIPSSPLPLIQSTEEQEQQKQDVIIINLTSSSTPSEEAVFVEVDQEPILSSGFRPRSPQQQVRITGRGSEVRSKLEKLAERGEEEEDVCPPHHQCGSTQQQFKEAFVNDISGFATEFGNTKQSFDEEFSISGSGGEAVKQQLNNFANDLFSSIGSGPESREVDGECGGDFVSSCYERLLDTKIDKLQEEMRRLEAQYWGNKL